jgi:hypothetical protein
VETAMRASDPVKTGASCLVGSQRGRTFSRVSWTKDSESMLHLVALHTRPFQAVSSPFDGRSNSGQQISVVDAGEWSRRARSRAASKGIRKCRRIRLG